MATEWAAGCGVSGLARVSLGLLIVAACRPSPSSTVATVAPVATAPNADLDMTKCQTLATALTSGDWDAAERDFDAIMRSKLPPPALGELWHRRVGSAGISSWSIVKRDHEYGKDRFTIELGVAPPLHMLVVFEPATGQIIGLFFPDAPRAEKRHALAPDPLVREIDEVVGNPPLALPASLTLPAGASRGPYPAVVLIAGSGPHDRDETIEHIRPFRDLAFTLAKHDVVALRYDKRTFAHRDLFDPKKGTVEEEVIADAVEAVARLRARPEIDRSRVFVAGHSLGALLAPEIAARAGGVAGLVLIAPPGRPILEITLEQLRLQGADPALVTRLAAQVHDLPNLAGDEQVFFAPASYWRDLDKRDEMGIAKKLGVPVLLLRGAMDQNVFAVDQERWMQALSGSVRVENVTLPGLTHLLVPAGTPLSTEAHVPDEVGARIAAFVTASAVPNRGQQGSNH